MPPMVRRKQFRCGFGIHALKPAIRQREVEPQHVVAKAAVRVVILTVHVVCDSTGNGRELRAWSGRSKPAISGEAAKKLSEGHTRVDDNFPESGSKACTPVIAVVRMTNPPLFRAVSP
jgi:hypothetical protein